MPLELVRKAIGDTPVASAVLAALAQRSRIAVDGGIVRLPAHQPAMDARQAQAGEAILAQLRAGGPEGRTLGELEAVVSAGTAGPLVEYYVRQGTAIRVGPDRYYHRGDFEALMRRALAVMRQLGQATVPQVRDAVGLTRKYLIPLLEWLDQKGFTARIGDARRLTPAGERYLKETGPELDAVSGHP
jgi:selenocysteine-specific elongation factor